MMIPIWLELRRPAIQGRSERGHSCFVTIPSQPVSRLQFTKISLSLQSSTRAAWMMDDEAPGVICVVTILTAAYCVVIAKTTVFASSSSITVRIAVAQARYRSMWCCNSLLRLCFVVASSIVVVVALVVVVDVAVAAVFTSSSIRVALKKAVAMASLAVALARKRRMGWTSSSSVLG